MSAVTGVVLAVGVVAVLIVGTWLLFRTIEWLARRASSRDW